MIGFEFRKVYIETTDKPFQWENHRNRKSETMGGSHNPLSFSINLDRDETQGKNQRFNPEKWGAQGPPVPPCSYTPGLDPTRH